MIQCSVIKTLMSCTEYWVIWIIISHGWEEMIKMNKKRNTIAIMIQIKNNLSPFVIDLAENGTTKSFMMFSFWCCNFLKKISSNL